MQKHFVGNMSLVFMALCFAASPLVDIVAADEAPMAGQTRVDSKLTEHDLILLGTVLHDAGRPMAIIQVGKAGEQGLYRLGDVVDGGRVIKIQSDSVTLTFAEIEVELQLVGGASSTSTAAALATGPVHPPLAQTEHGFWRVERETLNDLGRSSELIGDVTPLGDEGVRIDRVKANGLLHKLGLNQGDIIRSVDARMLGSGLSLQQALAQTRTDESLLRLEIDRQGEMDVLYYQFDPSSDRLDSQN